MEIGTYSFELTVTDNSGAIARDTVKVEVTYNISRTDDHNDVFIYPTLAQDVVNMNMQGDGTGQCEVTVYTINGQSALIKTFEKSGEGQKETLQVSSLQRGIYVMRIRIGKMLKVQKIVKM